MRPTIGYQEAVRGIDRIISEMPEALEAQETKVLRGIGKIVKTNISNFLDKSDIEKRYVKGKPKAYDGTNYVHMKSDVKVKVKKSKDGRRYVSIGGGKKTGYKWHMVNDGTVNTQGNNFMDKAVRKSQAEINQLISDMMREL